ncbi:MAG: ABC transporter permease [Acidilobus sp.]
MFIKEAKAWLAVSLFYMVLFPVAMIFALGFLVRGPYVYYLVSGTITFQVALTGLLMVPSSLGVDREAGRLSLMISAGVPPWAYAVTASLVNNLMAIGSALIVVGVASAMRYLSVTPLGVALLVPALIVSTFQGSMIGLAMAARIRNWRLLQQVDQIAAFGLTFFAPVYFPLALVPKYLLPLVMMEPTTYVAQAVRLSLTGSPLSLAWDLAALLYGLIFGALATRWGLS